MFSSADERLKKKDKDEYADDDTLSTEDSLRDFIDNRLFLFFPFVTRDEEVIDGPSFWPIIVSVWTWTIYFVPGASPVNFKLATARLTSAGIIWGTIFHSLSDFVL